MHTLAPLALVAALQGPGSARPGERPGAVLRCDGTPPELVNQDSVPHAFTLTCAGKVTERSLPAGEKAVLDGFSGCVLTLGEQTETLHTEMVCTIATGGKVTCDLL
jgi:hypothetical protein